MGCAAVDKGTNQPNKFVDAKSSESSLPHFSNGARDDLIQAQYLRAMVSFWDDPGKQSGFRLGRAENGQHGPGICLGMGRAPLSVLSGIICHCGAILKTTDGVTGSMGARPHGLWHRSVSEICVKAGVTSFDVSRLYGTVRGYIVSDVSEARASLQPLMLRTLIRRG